MSSTKRVRQVFSIKNELLKKSREAALSAVQIFNNPTIAFKSETFTVLVVIAWTYLLHAFYREKKIDYRHVRYVGKQKHIARTNYGADKRSELEKCLDDS